MKKQKQDKKLKHKNETVVLLNPVDLQGVQGGWSIYCTASNYTKCNMCSSSVP